MNRLIVPLGVLAMFGIFFAIVGDVGWRDRPVPDAALDAAPPPRDLGPPIAVNVDAYVTRVDAAPLPPPANPVEAFRRHGLLDRDLEDVDTFLAGGGFKRIEDRPEGTPTYDDHGTLLRLKVEGGSIVAIRADFPENAASAHLTALSWVVCGQRDHIRLHWDKDESGGALLQGSFDQDDGRTFYYRGMMRSTGDADGPAYIELSARPLK